MRHTGVLTPRGVPARPIDLADRTRRGQRVARARRVRRAVLRRWGPIALAALTAGALVTATLLAARWATTTPRFAVRRVEVEGVSRLRSEDVMRVAGVQPGVNLFRMSPRAAVTALEALPQVRRAEVVRHFPDRVVIQVEERRPFTLVHAGRLHWIDEQGVALGGESRAVPVTLPVISGFEPDELATARHAPSERLARGLSLVRMLLRSGSPMIAQISEIDVGRPEGPVLYTVDGIEVRIGDEDWEGRLARLMGVLAQIRTSGEAVSSVDLRFRDQVVLKPAAR